MSSPKDQDAERLKAEAISLTVVGECPKCRGASTLDVPLDPDRSKTEHPIKMRVQMECQYCHTKWSAGIQASFTFEF